MLLPFFRKRFFFLKRGFVRSLQPSKMLKKQAFLGVHVPPGRLRWVSDKAVRDFLARVECLLVMAMCLLHTVNLFIFPETQASATHLQRMG